MISQLHFLYREIPEQIEPEAAYNGTSGEKYIACYPYQSAEAGDLVFEVGEEVLVVKKDGDWWTGVIGNRTGIFPANYVQLPAGSAVSEVSPVANSFKSMNINEMSAEEARNQADADSEVSEINTQNVNNEESMQEFRGMTASAVSLAPSNQTLFTLKYQFIHRVSERRKEKSQLSLLHTKPRAANNYHFRKVSSS